MRNTKRSVIRNPEGLKEWKNSDTFSLFLVPASGFTNSLPQDTVRGIFRVPELFFSGAGCVGRISRQG